LIFNPTTGFAGNDSFTYQVTDNRGATSNIAQISIGVNSQSSLVSPEPSPSQPSTGSPETTPPGVINENPPSSSGTDYASICAKLQPVLVQSCGTLVSADGSLTSEGTHALNCIKNGILLGGGAAIAGVPLSIILKGLSILAAPTGCGDVVNMQGFNQLGNIGSLSSLTSLLP
jgi:hypothetical protein